MLQSFDGCVGRGSFVEIGFTSVGSFCVAGKGRSIFHRLSPQTVKTHFIRREIVVAEVPSLYLGSRKTFWVLVRVQGVRASNLGIEVLILVILVV